MLWRPVCWHSERALTDSGSEFRSSVFEYHVADYNRWPPVLNQREDTRRQRGATGHSIGREVADPNTIVIVNDFATLEGARAFSQDPSLPAAMARGGVEGVPQVWIVVEADARTY